MYLYIRIHIYKTFVNTIYTYISFSVWCVTTTIIFKKSILQRFKKKTTYYNIDMYKTPCILLNCVGIFKISNLVILTLRVMEFINRKEIQSL